MIDMENINKILIFLTFALIWLSVTYMITRPVETEIELNISNSLINDLMHPRHAEYNLTTPSNVTWITDESYYKFSNQTLNGTTHIRVRVPISLADIIIAVIKNNG